MEMTVKKTESGDYELVSVEDLNKKEIINPLFVDMENNEIHILDIGTPEQSKSILNRLSKCFVQQVCDLLGVSYNPNLKFIVYALSAKGKKQICYYQESTVGWNPYHVDIRKLRLNDYFESQLNSSHEISTLL